MTLDRPTVLIVDRDAAARAALGRMLRERGYDVREAATREAGFDLLDELAPDLLVLDDPAQERAYRLVWLNEPDLDDARIELLDAQPDRLHEQLVGLLDGQAA